MVLLQPRTGCVPSTLFFNDVPRFCTCLGHGKGGIQRTAVFCTPQAFQKVPPWSERIYTPGTHQGHRHPAISLKRAALFSSALLMSAEEGGCRSPSLPPLPCALTRGQAAFLGIPQCTEAFLHRGNAGSFPTGLYPAPPQLPREESPLKAFSGAGLLVPHPPAEEASQSF